jgi:CBS domain-containing protein
MLIADVLRTKGHEVVKVRATDTVRGAVAKLADRRIGAVIVEDQWMRVAGIFSERDFVNATADHGPAALDAPVSRFMSTRLITCDTRERIDAALATMTVARIRHLPVMEGGELRGIVSIGDLVKHRLDEKEMEAKVLLDISRMRA